MARAVIPVAASRAPVRARSRLVSDCWEGKIEFLDLREMVGLRARTSIFNRIFAGNIDVLVPLARLTSPVAPGCEGAVSNRFGECVRLETSLRSPLILSCNFFRTRCGMSNKSEVC